MIDSGAQASVMSDILAKELELKLEGSGDTRYEALNSQPIHITGLTANPVDVTASDSSLRSGTAQFAVGKLYGMDVILGMP
jgi:hypothetical protein